MKLILENSELKKTIDRIELEKSELKEILAKKENPGKQMLKENNEFYELKEVISYIFKTVNILISITQNFQEELNFYKKERENY